MGREIFGTISPGEVNVIYFDQNDKEYSVKGMLSKTGIVTGMSELYKFLKLKEDDTIYFDVTDDESIKITRPRFENVLYHESNQYSPDATHPIFDVNHYKHIHIQKFQHVNMHEWDPETEGDIYLTFGILQEFTDYYYCCGASQRILNSLGANYQDIAKPDAILVDRSPPSNYRMAEFKKLSSQFKSNHSPQDVDVLICWIHDETDQRNLPPEVVELYQVAHEAAKVFIENLNNE